MFCLSSAAIETDLKIEREWRSSLQKDLAKETELINQLKAEMLDAKKLQGELTALTDKHERLRDECIGQEQALSEMGDKLSE